MIRNLKQKLTANEAGLMGKSTMQIPHYVIREICSVVLIERIMILFMGCWLEESILQPGLRDFKLMDEIQERKFLRDIGLCPS